MEKYARQAVSEGVKNVEDLRVGGDSEIYRVLNLHYNRNNHIEVWGPQVRNTNTHTLHFILFFFQYCFANWHEKKTSMYFFATEISHFIWIVSWLILQNYAFCVNIFIVRFIKYFTCVFVVHYHCNCVCTFCIIKERSAWDIYYLRLKDSSYDINWRVHCTYKCQIFINKSSFRKFKKINLAERWKKDKYIYYINSSSS